MYSSVSMSIWQIELHQTALSECNRYRGTKAVTSTAKFSPNSLQLRNSRTVLYVLASTVLRSSIVQARNTRTRASDEEMSQGEPSTGARRNAPRPHDSDVQEVDDPKLLRAVSKKYSIDSTQSLVAAYNASTDGRERGVLFRWLRQYNRRNEECLSADTVFEYAQLAKIIPFTVQDEELLRKLVYALRFRLRQGEFIDSESIAEALWIALTWVEASVYNDTAQLVVVAKDLVSSLSSSPRLTRQNLAKHEATFLALHQTFFLLHVIGRTSLCEEEKKQLRRAVAKKMEEMKLSITYYPVCFHFSLIQQAIERLEIEDAPSSLEQAKRYTMSGLYGGLHAFHLLRRLASGDIDPVAVECAYKRSQDAAAYAGVSAKQWYDLLQILAAARYQAIKDETKIELFMVAYNVVMDGQRKTRKQDLKALRYGIVQETRLLTRQGCCKSVRKEATMKLMDVATNHAVVDNWIDDADVLTSLLDAVYEVHATGEYKEETTKVLQELQQSCEGRGRETLALWLDGDTMENKLRMQSRQETNQERAAVFDKIGREVGYLPLVTIRSNLEDLKETYQQDNFAKVN